MSNFLQEFKIWCEQNAENQDVAKGFFTVIRRHEQLIGNAVNSFFDSSKSSGGLHVIPYSQEYDAYLTEASELLHAAGRSADTPRYNYPVTICFYNIFPFDR